MPRRRWIYRDGEAIEVSDGYVAPSLGPMVIGEIPAYQSPVTGECIDSRAKRREDLVRNGCRPYEGREQESKEVARQRSYEEARSDAQLHEAAARAFYQMTEAQRRKLVYGS